MKNSMRCDLSFYQRINVLIEETCETGVFQHNNVYTRLRPRGYISPSQTYVFGVNVADEFAKIWESLDAGFYLRDTHAPRPTDVSSSPTVARRDGRGERRGCIWFTEERKEEEQTRRRRQAENFISPLALHLSLSLRDPMRARPFDRDEGTSDRAGALSRECSPYIRR